MSVAYTFVVLAAIISIIIVLSLRTIRKGNGAYQALYIALFFLSLFSAFLLKLGATAPTVHAFIPGYKLFALTEYGYASILHDLLTYAAPFLLAGFFIVPAYPKISFQGAFAAGAIAALLFNVYPLFNNGSFVTDEYLLAGLGLASGAAIYTILAFVLKKQLPLNEVKLPIPNRKRLSVSAWICGIVYVAIALVMVFDHGSGYAPVQFFESETPLPEDMALNCELGDSSAKVSIYIPSSQPVSERAAAIAFQLGINAETTNENGIYTADDGIAKLTMTESGSWVYESLMTPTGNLPTKESAAEAVRSLFSDKTLMTVSLGEVNDIIERTESDGTVSGYEVYISTLVNGSPIIGSSTLVASVRRGNTIVKIRRYDGDVLASSEVSIISEKKAYERLLAGECAYTLFSPAASASINNCYMAYMANSSQGYYLPVWVFSCSAVMEDGSEGAFDIYVEAIK